MQVSQGVADALLVADGHEGLVVGHIIYTGTDSYRFAQTQAEQAAAQAKRKAR